MNQKGEDMRNILGIIFIICLCNICLAILNIGMMKDLKRCPCHYSRTSYLVPNTSSMTGAAIGNKIGVAKNNPNKGAISPGAIIIVSRTGKVIDIKRF